MNKDGAKVLLMLGLLLIASGLCTNVRYLYRNNSETNSDEYITVDSSRWKMQDTSNDITIRLGIDELPVGPSNMMVYNINFPDFIEKNVKDLSKKIGFEINVSPEKIENYQYLLKDEKSVVVVYSSTEVDYYNKEISNVGTDVVVQWPSIGKEPVFSKNYIDIAQAEKIAQDFTKTHGGIPDDGQLDFRVPTTITSQANQTIFKFNDSYNFYFYRYIDTKYKVVGEGEKILIIVDNIGNIRFYSRCWLTEYQEERGTINIHSSYEALNSLKYAPFETTNAIMNITSVELSYFYPKSVYQTSTIRPTWVFYLDNGAHSLKVDAESLEQYFG